MVYDNVALFFVTFAYMREICYFSIKLEPRHRIENEIIYFNIVNII